MRIEPLDEARALLIALACLLGASMCAAAAAADASGWAAVPEILARIEPPQFPARNFKITEFGAVGEGQADARPAIHNAIAACHEAGGGRVIIPAGDWLVRGPIHLQSNVNLHLEAGAMVRFSTDPADYLPPVLTRFEGNELMNFSPLIYAHEKENIAITGAGTFDGQAGPDHWWPWKGRTGRGPNQTADSETLRRMAEDAEPAA